jgi:hypothetical protein
LHLVVADMDMSEYVLLEHVVNGRLADLQRERREVRPEEGSMSILAKMLYVASTLRARPRDIDRYIDYFGDRVLQKR